MEKGASDRVEEQSHTEMTIKTEVEEAVQSTSYSDVEITLNFFKEEPGLPQLVKSEPALWVKEEVVEVSWQDVDDLLVGSRTPQEGLMEHPGTCTKLQSLLLKTHKECLESSCRVRLRRLEIFQCEVCDVVYTDTHKLFQHVQEVHVKSPQTSGSTDRGQLCATDAQHSQETQPEQRAEPRPYRCDKCLKTFKRNSALQMHCSRVHGTGSHICTECNSKYKCAAYLENHMRNVHSKQQYECPDCKKMFKTKETLRHHAPLCRELGSAGAQHSEGTQPERRAQYMVYKCDKCPKTFKRYNILQTHCSRVHGTGSHECTVCNLKYKCSEYLVSHIRNVHSKQQYECAGCKKMCKSRQALRHHVPRCGELRPADPSLGTELSVYVCDYCQKTYKARHAIQIHIANLHASGSHKCSQCNKRFKCKKYVTLHVATVHSAGSHRQFTSNCGRNFKSKQNCQQHEKRCKCTRLIAGNTSAVASTSAQQHSVVVVKEEPADGELELGPTVFQHMDCNYRPYKQEPQLD